MDTFSRSFFGRCLLVCVALPLTAGGVGFLTDAASLDRLVQALSAEEVRRLRPDLLAALAAVLATAVLLYPIFRRLNRGLLTSLESVVRGDLEMARVLGAAIAQRDSDTGGHNARVTLYAIRLAESLGEPEVDMTVLILGAFLHDVGKIGVPDAILLKPGRLDPGETQEMRTHVRKGLDIIGSSKWLQLGESVVRCHHERFDGQGYPAGLAGAEIPLEARIFAVVDVFDALTSQRPYRTPMAFQEAMQHLRQGAGSHFDPALVAAFEPVAEAAHRALSEASEQGLEDRLQAEVERRLPSLFAAEAIHARVSAMVPKAFVATK